MDTKTTNIEGVRIIIPDVISDDRGFFMESYNREKFAALGIRDDFPQDNHSQSVQNTLRGLHFQTQPGQAKLIRAIRGRIWDVAVDIRPDSPTFKQWTACELSEENKQMFYVPNGCAHGFCVLSEIAEVAYKVSSLYNPETEAGISWNDQTINIDWPISNPLLSNRDMNNPTLEEFLKQQEIAQ